MKTYSRIVGVFLIWFGISCIISLFFLLNYGDETVIKYESALNNVFINHTGITLCYHSILFCTSIFLFIISKLFPKPINIGVIIFGISLLGGIFFSIYNGRFLTGYRIEHRFGWESIWHSTLIGIIFVLITLGFWFISRSKEQE